MGLLFTGLPYPNAGGLNLVHLECESLPMILPHVVIGYLLLVATNDMDHSVQMEPF